MPRAEFDRVTEKLAALETNAAQANAAAAVDAATAAGKIAPASRDWALGYAAADPDGFANFVSGAPVVVAPGAQARPPAADPDAPLDEDEKAVCAAMGISQEAFAASRAAHLNAPDAAAGAV